MSEPLTPQQLIAIEYASTPESERTREALVRRFKARLAKSAATPSSTEGVERG